MKLKIASKGYTIIVNSWENDGDYINTKTYIVYSLNQIKVLAGICELLKSGNDRDRISNEECLSIKAKSLIHDFVLENLDTICDILGICEGDQKIIESEIIEDIEDSYINLFAEIVYDLVGSSEFYFFRVVESYKVYYCEEDVYAKEIKL